MNILKQKKFNSNILKQKKFNSNIDINELKHYILISKQKNLQKYFKILNLNNQEKLISTTLKEDLLHNKNINISCIDFFKYINEIHIKQGLKYKYVKSSFFKIQNTMKNILQYYSPVRPISPTRKTYRFNFIVGRCGLIFYIKDNFLRKSFYKYPRINAYNYYKKIVPLLKKSYSFTYFLKSFPKKRIRTKEDFIKIVYKDKYLYR